MKENKIEFSYLQFENSEQLSEADAQLLEKAREVTKQAYAPYSNFNVGAVAILENGSFVSGTNQENASYPVGICAERVLLGNAATQYPGIAIKAIAISYRSSHDASDKPISPCGMCRQALVEYEVRMNHPIRVILSGLSGEVQIIEKANFLLPFAFTSSNLNKSK